MVIGEKFFIVECVIVGVMVVVGFILVVGWVGCVFKGGKVIYKIGKVVIVVDYVLDVYKIGKFLDIFKMLEMGVYGFVVLNGFLEVVIGRDMFGNKVFEEKWK